jgi:hypothetical protein
MSQTCRISTDSSRPFGCDRSKRSKADHMPRTREILSYCDLLVENWNKLQFMLYVTVLVRSNTEIVCSNPTEAWMFVFCVRFFCFYIVSSEATNRPNKRLMRTYHWISLFMSYTEVSKLAYRIWVILIANERVKKKMLYVKLSPYQAVEAYRVVRC